MVELDFLVLIYRKVKSTKLVFFTKSGRRDSDTLSKSNLPGLANFEEKSSLSRFGASCPSYPSCWPLFIPYSPLILHIKPMVVNPKGLGLTSANPSFLGRVSQKGRVSLRVRPFFGCTKGFTDEHLLVLATSVVKLCV